MNLDDLIKYKETIITKITQSKDIQNIILSANTDNSPTDPMLYNNIYPFLYTPTVQTNTKTFICVDCIVSKLINLSVKEIKIIIHVYSHKDIIQHADINTFQIKPDILSNMIDSILNSSREFGIGKLALESVNTLNLQDTYYGKILIYKCAEFNYNRKI